MPLLVTPKFWPVLFSIHHHLYQFIHTLTCTHLTHFRWNAATSQQCNIEILSWMIIRTNIFCETSGGRRSAEFDPLNRKNGPPNLWNWSSIFDFFEKIEGISENLRILAKFWKSKKWNPVYTHENVCYIPIIQMRSWIIRNL